MHTLKETKSGERRHFKTKLKLPGFCDLGNRLSKLIQVDWTGRTNMRKNGQTQPAHDGFFTQNAF